MEEAKQSEINKAFLARDGPPMVEVWQSDDDEEEEEAQQNTNYFCFMALGEEDIPDHSEVFNFTPADGSEPSPLHQQVIEKVTFMLKDNHLTSEQFEPEISEIGELVSDYVFDAEARVLYYKSEMNAIRIKLDELTRCSTKLERILNEKTKACKRFADQFRVALNQRDIIAKDNREMYALLNARMESYKASKDLLDENDKSIQLGPKPKWIKYGVGFDDLNNTLFETNLDEDTLTPEPSLFKSSNDFLIKPHYLFKP